jgi:hypothetical protein
MHTLSFISYRFTLIILLFTLGSSISNASPKLASFDPALAFQRDFYTQSNLEFTLLHELAHAVIELNDIPVLGGQEQAADQVALMLLLMADDSNRKEINPKMLNKLLAISGEWMLEWQGEKKNNQPIYWDTHPLAIQRFYEVTCLVYGSNPDKLESLRKESMLPVERAWDCDLEFKKTRKALAWLVTEVTDYKFDESWNLVKVKDSKGLFTGRIKVVWLEPSSQEQKRIKKTLKSFSSLAKVLEQLNNLLNLKTDITIYMTPSCRGPDAWWNGNNNILTVCYDLIKQFEKNSLLLPDLVKEFKSGSKD